MRIHASKTPTPNQAEIADGKRSIASTPSLSALSAHALLLGLIAATAFVVAAAHAQTAPLATPPATAEVAPVAPTAPKYAAQDVERAFGFIDANHDGKISRSEAAGFRNVAKYFDAADLNKDDMLSRAEFANAMNGGKSQ